MLCGRQIISCKTCLHYRPQYRHFGMTISCLLNQRFRKERGLPLNPNASGALTDSPDYSYLDGRITPLGQGQRKRIIRNQQVKEQILALSKEIDFAVERYKNLQLEDSNRKQNILEQKLKPKGNALLKSKN